MERDKQIIPKIYVAPMSLAIVDSIIDYNNNNQNKIGLIASRRQIDYDGGYVNNWNTQSFTKYVKSKSNTTLIFS